MTIKNTLKFNPATTETFGHELVPADTRGSIMVNDGEVTGGQEVIDKIRANADQRFLVSKAGFDYLVELGFSNVCMFDPSKTVYGEDGRAIAQGGLLFP